MTTDISPTTSIPPDLTKAEIFQKDKNKNVIYVLNEFIRNFFSYNGKNMLFYTQDDLNNENYANIVIATDADPFESPEKLLEVIKALYKSSRQGDSLNGMGMKMSAFTACHSPYLAIISKKDDSYFGSKMCDVDFGKLEINFGSLDEKEIAYHVNNVKLLMPEKCLESLNNIFIVRRENEKTKIEKSKKRSPLWIAGSASLSQGTMGNLSNLLGNISNINGNNLRYVRIHMPSSYEKLKEVKKELGKAQFYGYVVSSPDYIAAFNNNNKYKDSFLGEKIQIDLDKWVDLEDEQSVKVSKVDLVINFFSGERHIEKVTEDSKEDAKEKGRLVVQNSKPLDKYKHSRMGLEPMSNPNFAEKRKNMGVIIPAYAAQNLATNRFSYPCDIYSTMAMANHLCLPYNDNQNEFISIEIGFHISEYISRGDQRFVDNLGDVMRSMGTLGRDAMFRIKKAEYLIREIGLEINKVLLDKCPSLIETLKTIFPYNESEFNPLNFTKNTTKISYIGALGREFSFYQNVVEKIMNSKCLEDLFIKEKDFKSGDRIFFSPIITHHTPTPHTGNVKLGERSKLGAGILNDAIPSTQAKVLKKLKDYIPDANDLKWYCITINEELK